MRAMLWVGGSGLFLVALIGAGHLWAKERDKKPKVLDTPIALFNLNYVIQKYDKYRDVQEEIKGIAEPYQRRETSLRRQGEKLKAELEQLQKDVNPGDPHPQKIAQKKEELEHKAKMLQREIEDNQMEAKLKISKRTEAAMKDMYVDVYDAASRYAKEHDFEILLHYNDATNAQDYFGAPNIARKLSTGALVPLTTKPGVDVTKGLIELLNLGPREKP